MAQQTDQLLVALVAAGVDFVVAGGVAANLHGSSYLTRDFDVLAPLTVDNCRRLLASLAPYQPRFYQAAGKPLVTRTAEELAAFQNLYLSTTLGVLDVLGSMPPLGDYASIAARAVEVLSGRGVAVGAGAGVSAGTARVRAAGAGARGAASAGSVASKVTSSITTVAPRSSAARNRTRTRALCASAGACTGPVETTS